MPDDRIKILAEFTVLLTGLNFGILFVVDVTTSTRCVLDSSVIFTGWIVESDGVCIVVDPGCSVVGASLQNAVRKKYFPKFQLKIFSFRELTDFIQLHSISVRIYMSLTMFSSFFDKNFLI